MTAERTTPPYPTGLGTSDATSIRLLGQDLATELLGRVSFGELAFWLVAKRRPDPGETRVFEAVLVALADHGFTPTAIAARLTYLSAPDALQGALAAGLLGGGSRFLGVTEDTGRFLTDALHEAQRTRGALPSPTGGRASHAGADTPPPEGREEGREGEDADTVWDEIARDAVRRRRAAGLLVPGLGHPVHKQGDPRTPVILTIADEAGLRGPHLRLFEAVGRVHPGILGRTLPLNGAGVCGAALADLGFQPEILRGFALLARAAGLLGHLAEEREQPIAARIYESVDRNAAYVAPPAS